MTNISNPWVAIYLLIGQVKSIGINIEIENVILFV